MPIRNLTVLSGLFFTAVLACSGGGGTATPGSGGTGGGTGAGTGGSPLGSGGSTAGSGDTGGNTDTGGTGPGTGGEVSSTGGSTTGGTPGSGGSATGGTPGSGGSATGGTPGSGGSAAGGTNNGSGGATGNRGGSGGATGGTAGASSASGGGAGSGSSSGPWCLPVSAHPMGLDWAKALIDSRRNATLTWQYMDSLYLHGVYLSAKRLGSADYLTMVRSWADKNLSPTRTYDTLDNMQPTIVLNDMYRETHDAKYSAAPKAVADRLETPYPKTKDGGFWHTDAEIGGSQLWGDGVFMNLPPTSLTAISTITARPTTSRPSSSSSTTSTWRRPKTCTDTTGTRIPVGSPVVCGVARKAGTRWRFCW